MTSPGLIRRHAIALGLYAATAFMMLLPQSLHPGDAVWYVGDSLDSVYFLAWNAHQLPRDPRHLFDANILYPHRQAALFDEPRILPGIVSAPVTWATGNPILGYNLALLLVYLFDAMAGRSLGRALGLDDVGSWGAGALYAFHTYAINESPRINTIFHGFLPLALADLVRFLRSGEKRYAWRVGGWMLLQGFACNYHILYGALLLSLTLLAFLAARPGPTLRRAPGLVPPAAVATLVFLPIVIAYLHAARLYGYVQELPRGVDLAHYLSTAPGNLLYGAIGVPVRTQQQGPHFVGFVSLALVLLALAAWFRRRRGSEGEGDLLPTRVWVPAAAALALVFVALSLGREVLIWGHDLGAGPYRLLYDHVPGFEYLRIPERLSLLAMLFVGLLAGRGLSLLGRRGLGVLAVLLAALVPLEHLSPFPSIERLPVGREVPAVYRWLAGHSVHALAEVPVRGEGLVRTESLEEYFSTYHFKPIIHGYVTHAPLLTVLLRRVADTFPSLGSLEAFQRVGVDTVVVHRGRLEGIDLYHQVLAGAGDSAEKQARYRQLLKIAGLDLYDRLPEAVSSRRIRRAALFAGPAAHVYDGTADEVYRLLPIPPGVPAPFPGGHRLRDVRWRYRAKLGNPALAADGDRATSWRIHRSLRGDEYIAVDFDRPLRVAGLVLPLDRDSIWPTRFRVVGRDAALRWQNLARFDDAHVLQLLDRLLADPRSAAIGFDLGDRELTGLGLFVEEGGTSFDGWSLPELEIRVP